jgi:hypothetical protein
MTNSAKEEVKGVSRTRRNVSTNAGLIEIQIQYRALAILLWIPVTRDSILNVRSIKSRTASASSGF